VSGVPTVRESAGTAEENVSVDEDLAYGALPGRVDVRRVTMLLAAVAGWTDAVGFLVLFGLFTAHMSGNTTHLGVSIGEGDWSDAVTRFFPIPVFVVGIVVGAVALEVIHHRRQRSGVAILLLAEAALLAGFMALGKVLADWRVLEPNSAAFFLLATLATLSMGLQTATLRRVGRVTVHTTFISGMLTQFSVLSVRLYLARRNLTGPDEQVDPHATRVRIRLLGLIWLCYLAGGVVGAWVQTELGFFALCGPVLVLVALAFYDVRRDLAAE
jgi:uncharacterized membrane protein YoaK (UPF0700 family)